MHTTITPLEIQNELLVHVDEYDLHDTLKISNSSINISLLDFNESLLLSEDHNYSIDTNKHGMDYRWQRFLSQPHQIIALVLSLIAILLNVMSLCAMLQIQNRVSGHYRFIVSLALSDIVIGVSSDLC